MLCRYLDPILGTGFFLTFKLNRRMDVVIPFADNTSNNFLELRYALRALRHLTSPVGKVWLVGQALPKWIRPDAVGFIPVLDNLDSRYRERNMALKTFLACKEPTLTEEFLYFHDDHFILPGFNEYLWPCEKRFGGNETYQRTVRNTQNLFPFSIFNYDLHRPCVMERQKFFELFLATNWAQYFGYCIKTLYYYKQVVGEESVPVFAVDVKLNEPGRDLFWWRGQVQHLTCFSVGPRALSGGQLELLLEELYPKPSIWEVHHSFTA